MVVREKIRELPDSPGVYIFKDKKGNVLYIGKASSLRKRVSSHFSHVGTFKEEMLQKKVEEIEYILTPSEAEALLIEAALIKEKQPRYNIDYRDDKSYPFLKISWKEKFPRVFMGRGRREKGILYFGPYSNVKLLRSALKTIRKIFPFRSCRNLPSKECLYYSLRLCPAPCTQKVSEEEYRKNIHALCLLLEGKIEELENEMVRKMEEKAKIQDFEEAAKIRDQLKGLVQLKALRLGVETVFQELKDTLGLSKPPERIEAFDLSHLFGSQAVGAMVSFYKGVPDKDNYRRFKIKLAHPLDDFSMLREVVFRRFKRILEEKRELPDLVLIDGGRGHLEVAKKELEKLGLDIELIALAKGEELIYTLKRKEPIRLPLHSHVLQFLERIRDEAHRFAISYHKKLYRKSTLGSELEEIRGIGEKRRKALIGHFGSLAKIKEASLEELLKVKGMNRKIAEELINYFRK